MIRFTPFFLLSLLLLCAAASHVQAANVCAIQGKVLSVIPSGGDAGVFVAGQISGCSCAGSSSTKTLLWIDVDSNGGKSLYATALAARTSNLPVTATVVDGQGQTNAANNSVWQLFWPTCQINALEM